jgi:hypothetical protein
MKQPCPVLGGLHMGNKQQNQSFYREKVIQVADDLDRAKVMK